MVTETAGDRSGIDQDIGSGPNPASALKLKSANCWPVRVRVLVDMRISSLFPTPAKSKSNLAPVCVDKSPAKRENADKLTGIDEAAFWIVTDPTVPIPPKAAPDQIRYRRRRGK